MSTQPQQTSTTTPNNTAKLSQDKLPISIAYAPTPNTQLYKEIMVDQGTRLIDALQLTGWLTQYPELAAWCEAYKNHTQIDKKIWRVGVFADKKLLTYTLQANDRVEVYRPLTIDPMGKRKKRAIRQ